MTLVNDCPAGPARGLFSNIRIRLETGGAVLFGMVGPGGGGCVVFWYLVGSWTGKPSGSVQLLREREGSTAALRL